MNYYRIRNLEASTNGIIFFFIFTLILIKTKMNNFLKILINYLS